MNRIAFVALSTAIAITGCKKSEENTPAPSAPSTKEPAPAATPAPAAAPAATPAKAEYKPDEIWKETVGLSRMDRAEKFSNPIALTGTVKEVKDDPVGEYVLVFDAGDGKSVRAPLLGAQAARDKKIKAGDSVTLADCGIANPSDTELTLTTCTLK
jgi:hypothetical protein